MPTAVTKNDASTADGSGATDPKKKKKMGKKQRQRAKVAELEASGMSRNEARVAAGLKPLADTWRPAGMKVVKKSRPPGERLRSPALLTANIKRSQTLGALFETCWNNASRLNYIHLSACWNCLGRLATVCEDQYWYQEHAESLEWLVDHTMEMVADPYARPGARELANIAHGAAKTGRGGSMMIALMDALARAIEVRLGDCKSQELANIAWAFAKSEKVDNALFSALATSASPHLHKFNSQELTNFIWAFATAGHLDKALFDGFARVSEQRLHDFSNQGFANTAWAFAKAGHLDMELFRAMSNAAQERMAHFNAQDFANIAWSFAKLGQCDPTLFLALAKDARRHLKTMNEQGLTNTVWAFTKADYFDAELFAAFGRSIKQRLSSNSCAFNSQDVSNTAWAFAKACHVDKALFEALSTTAAKCLEEFNTQDLLNTMWAFAKVGHSDTHLFAAMGQSIVRSRLSELDASAIANIAWAFDKVGQLDTKLSAALAKTAQEHICDFGAQDLSKVAWTFANVGQVDAQLFAALAWSAEEHFDDFDDEDIDNLEWAFTKCGGQQKIVKRLRQRKKVTGGDAKDVSSVADMSKCGRVVVAGGGIGGAALAVALQQKGFDVLVLEADASFDARKQGYGLTVQAQDAIQAMGINLAQDDAPSTSHYTFSSEGHILGLYGEAFGIKSKDRKEADNSGRFIHIPRQMLRSRLLEAVKPGSVRWGSKLKSFYCSDEQESDRKVSIKLVDGTELDAAILVGCDGIFSTVRRQLKLSGDRLNYVGLVVVLGIVEEQVMAVNLAKRRIFETVDGTTRIYAMPFTTSSTMWQLSFPCPEETARAYMKDGAALKAEITRRCAAWHEPIPAMLRKTPLDCMSGYPVYDRELLVAGVLRPSQTRRRVTLMGDAAHPMTPFKAQGANQAMSDAVLLAECLTEGVAKFGPCSGLDHALPIFEQKMLSRSSRVVVGSRAKAREMHSALALQPARRVQREGEFDMQAVIPVLRAKGIGACSATDPRGLDAVVEAEASAMSCSESSGTHAQTPVIRPSKILFHDNDAKQIEHANIDEHKNGRKKEKKKRTLVDAQTKAEKKTKRAAKKARKAQKNEKGEKTRKAKVDSAAENAEKESALTTKDKETITLALRLQLATFYCKFNPSKLADVNKLAAHYQDKQMKLNEKLMSQYGKDLSYI